MPQVAVDSPWLTTTQMAERWHTTTVAIHKRRQRGEMPPATRMGRELLYHVQDVEAFEQQARALATATP